MAKKEKKKKKKAIKKKGQYKVQMFLIGCILLSALFLPTAFFLFVGLLPFFAAFFTDRSKKKTRVITVGAMNFAACVPFLMRMWTTEHSLAMSIHMMTEVIPLIVIYAAAGVGYMIDWAMSSVVSSLLYQRGLSRQKTIEKRQIELIERWGPEVAGAVALDANNKPLPVKKQEDII